MGFLKKSVKNNSKVIHLDLWGKPRVWKPKPAGRWAVLPSKGPKAKKNLPNYRDLRPKSTTTTAAGGQMSNETGLFGAMWRHPFRTWFIMMGGAVVFGLLLALFLGGGGDGDQPNGCPTICDARAITIAPVCNCPPDSHYYDTIQGGFKQCICN